MQVDTNGAFEKAATEAVAKTAEQKPDNKTEIMKIELEIARQYAVKAAYAVMITQADQVIQELMYQRMKFQAAEQGLDVGLLEQMNHSQS